MRREPFRLLDLFSGIGGFSLGLERSRAFKTVAFCEIEPFCQRVLKKHWPNVPCYEDIRTLTATRLAADGIGVDAICGGFPCQDISVAGKGAGLAGERSGLWREYARLIGELKERQKIEYVLLENVAALLGRGMGDVLRDLAALGFDAEWHCIPASAVGLPHIRDRVWIVAYPREERGQGKLKSALPWLYGVPWGENERRAADFMGRSDLYDPRLCRASDGIPDRAHRVASCGNAVVPQIPELIGRAIAQAEGMTI